MDHDNARHCHAGCTAFEQLLRDHYASVLAAAERQRRCLNPAFPRGLVPAEIEQFSLSTLCPLPQFAPEPGRRLLDVGCGAGADCLLAAALLGVTGRAVGLDPAPQMVAKARSLAIAHQVSNADFAVADARNLPHADASFDYVTMNFAFHLFPDKRAAIAEARRVLRPGGLLAVADSFAPRPEIDLRQNPGDWFLFAAGAIEPLAFQQLALRSGFSTCEFRLAATQESSAPAHGYMIAHTARHPVATSSPRRPGP